MKAQAGQLARTLRAALLPVTQAVLRRPGLAQLAAAALDRFPALRRALRKVLRGPGWRPRDVHVPQTPNDLSPETLAALRALQAAFAQQRH